MESGKLQGISLIDAPISVPSRPADDLTGIGVGQTVGERRICMDFKKPIRDVSLQNGLVEDMSFSFSVFLELL